MNSRNPCAKGYKSPLKISNQKCWLPFLDEAAVYIKGLKSSNGEPMCETRRKTDKVNNFYRK